MRAADSAGAGMIHRVTWRVASEEALDFWEKRLADAGVADRARRRQPHVRRSGGTRARAQRSSRSDDEPLVADHPEIPKELALQGFDSVRAYSRDPDRSRQLFEDALGFQRAGRRVLGDPRRQARIDLPLRRAALTSPGLPGAGTVHHVAWASQMEDHEAWRDRAIEAGARPTPVIDRFYFKSIYFREPSGVLFEIATIGPGFATDEPLEHLGERLSLPPNYEHLREQLEPILTPLPDPRAVRAR